MTRTKSRNDDYPLTTKIDTYINNLRDRFFDLGTSVYKWTNLDKYSIPIRQPEKLLYENGMFCYVEYKKVPMLLPVATGTIVDNVYGEPSSWRAVPVGTKFAEISTIKLNDSNSVIVRNNYSRRPTKLIVEDLLYKLRENEIAYRSQNNGHKLTVVFETDPDTLTQTKSIYKAICNADPLYLNGKINQPEQLWFNSLPFILDKLTDESKSIINSILTWEGIDNVPVEKQERLLTGEVEGNDEVVNLVRDNGEEERKAGCDKMNDLIDKSNLPYHLDVEINPKMQLDNTTTGDISNGIIYNETGTMQ